MKSWQLYDIIRDDVIAESNEYMELNDMRDRLLTNYIKVGSHLIDYNEDSSKGDLKGKWIICNSKSELFKKRRTND